MALLPYAVRVVDAGSDEVASFLVEASSPLIACTRAASRLLGPDAETRPVYGCAVCGAELWEGEGLDSSGFRFCEECTPEELESREEQESIGLVAGTARITATELAPLPGDAPIGPVTVVVGDPDGGLERDDGFSDDDDARAAIERALAADGRALDDILGDLTVRDSMRAYFRYRVRPAPVSVDAHDLVARGLIDEKEEEEEDDEEEEDGDEEADEEDGEEEAEEEDEDEDDDAP